jgi:hypothetical protein
VDESNLSNIDARLAQELDDAKAGIEELALTLCIDPMMAQRHSASLQQFDYLAQIIGEVSNVLRERHVSPLSLQTIRLDAMLSRVCDNT